MLSINSRENLALASDVETSYVSYVIIIINKINPCEFKFLGFVVICCLFSCG